MNLCRAFYVNVALVLAAYAVCYLLGQGPLAHLYTPEWTSRRIWFVFAPATLAVAMFGPRRAWWWSLAGYPVGVLLGELIGLPLYRAALARLEDQLRDPSYQQDWQPGHPGWWITILVILAATVIGWLVQRRRQAGVTCSRA